MSSSSGNRFADLGDAPSSSKEQETQVPFTGTERFRKNSRTGEEPPVYADVASDGSEESDIKDIHHVGTKQKRSPSIDEQRSSKRTIDPESTTISLPCVISINEQEPFGSLYPANDGFATLLFIDPGRDGPPTVQLAFRNSGTENGKDLAKNAWDMDSRIWGEWAMDHVVTGHATPGGTDLRMSNQTVLADCAEQDTDDLMYMRFKSWSEVLGFHKRHLLNGQSAGIQKSMKTMFQSQDSYLLEFWFITPFAAPNFQRDYLRCFTESLAYRQNPLSQWKDLNGVYFNDIPKLPRPDFLVRGLQREPLHMPSATKKPKPLPNTTIPRTQHAGAAQDMITGSDRTSNQAEQSTAEPQLILASQHPETLTPTAAQDAKMSNRSTSVPPETHPTPETQAMLTFGVGPLPSPAQDQRTSASNFSFGFEVPTSTPSRLSGPRPGFVPEFHLGLLDRPDDDSEFESDSDTESNGDRERQHEGQGEGDGRAA